MRTCLVFGLAAAVSISCASKPFDGPTVDAFTGRVTSGGQPVAFPAGEEVTLHLFHEKAQSFIIPLRPDGSFKIGWMPIGKYSATLVREQSAKKGGQRRHNVPGGLMIADGQTEYVIDLGKDWKP